MNGQLTPTEGKHSLRKASCANIRKWAVTSRLACSSTAVSWAPLDSLLDPPGHRPPPPTAAPLAALPRDVPRDWLVVGLRAVPGGSCCRQACHTQRPQSAVHSERHRAKCDVDAAGRRTQLAAVPIPAAEDVPLFRHPAALFGAVDAGFRAIPVVDTGWVVISWSRWEQGCLPN